MVLKRRETGRSDREVLTDLMRVSGAATPTAADLDSPRRRGQPDRAVGHSGEGRRVVAGVGGSDGAGGCEQLARTGRGDEQEAVPRLPSL